MCSSHTGDPHSLNVLFSVPFHTQCICRSVGQTNVGSQAACTLENCSCLRGCDRLQGKRIDRSRPLGTSSPSHGQTLTEGTGGDLDHTGKKPGSAATRVDSLGRSASEPCLFYSRTLTLTYALTPFGAIKTVPFGLGSVGKEPPTAHLRTVVRSGLNKHSVTSYNSHQPLHHTLCLFKSS